jgi:hypothetical protein
MTKCDFHSVAGQGNEWGEICTILSAKSQLSESNNIFKAKINELG